MIGRSRRPITEADRVQITLARFERVQKSGLLTPLKELSQRFGRDNAIISRAISRALREGLVEIQVGRPLACDRQTDLQRDLLTRYPGLTSAIVVGVEPPPEGSLQSEAALRYGDQVHRQLGWALAKEVSR